MEPDFDITILLEGVNTIGVNKNSGDHAGLMADLRRQRIAAILVRRPRITQRQIHQLLASDPHKGGLRNPETNEPYSLATINKDVKWLRAQIKKRARQDTDAWVAAELDKLDAIEEAAWNEKDFATILKAMKRRADLLGLDAPSKIAPTTPDGNDEYTGLTDTERLERLAALFDTARARADGSPP